MILIKIIFFLLICAASGQLYRMGGSNKYNTKVRDFGVPIMALLAMLVLGRWHWSLAIAFWPMFGCMTTYWKQLNKFFDDTTDDAHWYNWLAHGFMIGLAMLPYAIMTHCVGITLLRAVVLGAATMAWSEKQDDVEWEERGRGALVSLTLLLYLLCR